MPRTWLLLTVGVSMLLIGSALVVAALHPLRDRLSPYTGAYRVWLGRFRGEAPGRFLAWTIGQVVRVVGFVVMIWGDRVFPG
jgi:hypothetical protein